MQEIINISLPPQMAKTIKKQLKLGITSAQANFFEISYVIGNEGNYAVLSIKAVLKLHQAKEKF